MSDIEPGQSYPLGATVYPRGVNFAMYSRRATAVELLLFDRVEDRVPSRVIRMTPEENRTFNYWHAFVPGIGAGQIYGYRVFGPYLPDEGVRHDPSKLLVDPYARAVAYTNYQRGAAAWFGFDNIPYAMKSVVVDPTAYNWEGDRPLHRNGIASVIYEMHVRGFTGNPNSGVAPEKRGTYAGLIEKIPYLVDLGITAVELMPVQQFDPQAAPYPRPNYWGYEPVAYFAPHRGFSSRTDPIGPVDEFRDMVKALHRAGIEVILDVVYNHTAEDDQNGPTLAYRGIANTTYYMLNPLNRAEYINYSGVGNTLNANNSIVRRMIMDSLRYWVEHMHVDGFRFDLASILSRGVDGQPLSDPPILWSIETDPVLAGTKIIAEAWDAGGLYQVGTFIGLKWAVWNGQFRDTVRRFVKSDAGMTSLLGDAISGSPMLFHQLDRDPSRSINFITSHDGFTLNDLVTYNEKHNWANGEENRDGTNDNYSWNCGVEGPTNNKDVEALRSRQVRNMLTLLLIAEGRPMLLMGDEVRRTQNGNNNAYCQDNETSWFDWEDVVRHGDVLRFVQLLIRFHQHSCFFRDETFWVSPGGTEVHWHGQILGRPDFGPNARCLAFELINAAENEHLYVILNAFWEPLEFELPRLAPGQTWRRFVDTSNPPPDDIGDPPAPLAANTRWYVAGARSTVVLVTGMGALLS